MLVLGLVVGLGLCLGITMKYMAGLEPSILDFDLETSALVLLFVLTPDCVPALSKHHINLPIPVLTTFSLVF